MSKPQQVGEPPEGAVRIHMGSIETTWKPRGSLQKNSLSAELLSRLTLELVYWTDQKYGDSLTSDVAATLLIEGLRKEVEIAIKQFLPPYELDRI